MASLIGPSRVDWDVVDEELDRVPEEFKDPRFDSLRHVLDILSAVDAEAALEELKSQQERIEELVDNVVQGYHSGFNKAIHNYSQILHLFSVSKDQVNKIRSQLEDAQRRLTSQSHSLEVQWKRSVTLDDTVKLFVDIRGFVSLPQQVQELQEAKKWKEAVATLLDGCSRLARPEYLQIGALKEIKRELALLRNSMLRTIVQEIERSVYEDLSSAAQLSGEGGGSLQSCRSTPRQNSTPKLGLRLAISREEQASSKNSMESRGSLTAQPRVRPGPAGNASLEGPCQDLIQYAVRLGGLVEMQSSIRRHLPTQIKRVVLRALEGCTNIAKPSQADNGAAANVYVIEPAVAENAAKLVNRVIDTCLQVLHNLVTIVRQIGAAKNPPGSSGLDLMLAARPPESQLSGHLSDRSGSAYARREVDFAWDCMQKEVQALFSELIQPGNSATNLAGLTTALNISVTIKDDTAKLDANAKRLVDSCKDVFEAMPPALLPEGSGLAASSEGSKLSFSFDVQVRGVAARTLLQRENSLGKWEGGELTTLVKSALWGSAASIYLTPYIFLPTRYFTDEAAVVLSALERDSDSFGGAWWSGEKSDSRLALRLFKTNLVENVFMPALFMDYKDRCARILEDPEAMRARAKPEAYTAEVGKGRALLPAVRVAEAFVEELLQWGTLMPPFASRMSGILENVLGKVYTAFQARAASLMGSAACKKLSEDPILAAQMAAEPAAPQAGEAVAFFVERSGGEGIDQFVASILQSGFGTGGEAAEVGVLQRILKERPVSGSTLLTAGDPSRVMNLAAAADSLDYLADVIQSTILEHRNLPMPFMPSADKLGSVKLKALAESSSGTSAVAKAQGMQLESLEHLVDRYRSLAGQCLRALRLDMLLLVVHHLGALPVSRFVCEAAEAQDVDECIGALQRCAARVDEAVAPFLAPSKRAYVFGSMAAAAARLVIWLLPELKALNQAGLARMCRMLAVLQPFLAALGSADRLYRPEAARHLERARAYYAHLTYSPPALIAAAAARPTRFTPKEYLALLEVDFAGRTVEDAQRAEMAKTVLAASKQQNAKPQSLFSRA